MLKFKRKTSIAIALGLLISSSVPFISSVQKVSAQALAVGPQKQVIVVFKDKATANNKGADLKSKGKVQKEFKNVNSLKASLSDSEIADLQKDPNVLSVEEDSKVYAIQDYQDWGITKIGAQNSQASGLTGAGVKVAIIDTGIDTTHPDFAGAIAGGISEVAYTTSIEDDNGHGTHVAGVVGARNNATGIVGTAPDSSLYIVKALDSTGNGYMSDIVAGIDWSIQNQMDIVSMSLGASTPSTALKTAVDTAYADGLLVVAAAGNTGTATPTKTADTINYPAKYNEAVIAVGATDSSNVRASFSSSGVELEVVAPGVSITSDYLGGQYAQMSGTSMATPYVAGDLALLKQKYPTYTNVQLRAMLDKSVTDLGARGKDNLYGYGLIKAPIK